MTDIILTGCNGRMGKALCELVGNDPDARYRIFAGVDICAAPNDRFHVYETITDLENPHGVIIDFSFHKTTCAILAYAKRHKLPAVIATTGHTEEEKAAILAYAKDIPLFLSANMSLGINLIINLAKKAAKLLQDSFDIEIVEKHHNKKIDAPSGTALLIANGIRSVLDYEPEYKYERHSEKKQREKTEIGLHAIRGGTIVGEHDVIFAGKDELITLSHRADSRFVFASGALKAAEYLKDMPNGLYDMNSMLANLL